MVNNLNFYLENFDRKNRTNFSAVPVLPEIFHSKDLKSRVLFILQPDFPETFCTWWKTHIFTCNWLQCFNQSLCIKQFKQSVGVQLYRSYFSHQQVQETSVYTQINISVRHKNRIKSLKFQHLLLVRSTRQSMAARRTSSKWPKLKSKNQLVSINRKNVTYKKIDHPSNYNNNKGCLTNSFITKNSLDYVSWKTPCR